VHQARDAAGSAEKVSLSFTLPVCTGGLFEEVGDRGFARVMVMNLSKRNRPSRAVERLHSRVIATSRTNLPVSIGKRSPNMTDGRNWLAWSMDPAALECLAETIMKATERIGLPLADPNDLHGFGVEESHRSSSGR
jgi:hypothetical protein